ncbi:MAG: aldolase/citrate lyase family protein, partial [Caldilineaceae bacterium]|nr:aldolase/citrate lyase family protein [Caldilineaceae bacterium]
IEDIAAINNLAEILTVDHIDVFFVAPSDLAQSMGHLGNTDHPEVVATIEGAFAQIRAAGRAAGGLVSDDNVGHYIGLGVQFLLTGWAAWVASGGQAFLGKVEKADSS